MAKPSAATTATFAVSPRENIVVFGDSITADGGYSQIIQDIIDREYPGRAIRVIPHGVHGDTAQHAHTRLERDVIANRPAWVLLNFGVNDLRTHTRDEFLAHYERLINRIARDTAARIVIVSPIYFDRPAEDPAMTALVAGLRDLAKKYALAYAPVYEETRRLRPTLPEGICYAVDGSHPNLIGQWIFAQTILASLGHTSPSDAKPHAVEVPARYTVKDKSDTRAGLAFRLALPMPLDICLTNPPPLQATAPRATNPVVIDGDLRDWPLAPADTTSVIILGAPSQRTWGVASWSRDRHQAQAYFTWDADGLYFAIRAEDSLLRNPAGTKNLVDRDCVELAIDARPPSVCAAQSYSQIKPSGTPGVVQYIFAPAGDEAPAATAHIGNGDKNMLNGVTVASRPTSFGWQLEAKIPAAHFPGRDWRAGQQIKLDVTLVNLDRGNHYIESISFRWTGSRWSAFSTREFGILTLAE